MFIKPSIKFFAFSKTDADLTVANFPNDGLYRSNPSQRSVLVSGWSKLPVWMVRAAPAVAPQQPAAGEKFIITNPTSRSSIQISDY